jgi:hypothetical protein
MSGAIGTTTYLGSIFYRFITTISRTHFGSNFLLISLSFLAILRYI